MHLLRVGYDGMHHVKAQGHGPLPHQRVGVHSIKKITFWLTGSKISSVCVNSHLAPGIASAIPQSSLIIFFFSTRQHKSKVSSHLVGLEFTAWYAYCLSEWVIYGLNINISLPPPLIMKLCGMEWVKDVIVSLGVCFNSRWFVCFVDCSHVCLNFTIKWKVSIMCEMHQLCMWWPTSVWAGVLTRCKMNSRKDGKTTLICIRIKLVLLSLHILWLSSFLKNKCRPRATLLWELCVCVCVW